MRLSFGLLLATALSPVSAQDDTNFISRILREDSAATEAIAQYPKDVRENIYIACSYPEVLAHMNNRQKDTKEKFREIISGHNREEQKKIWNLTTYPGLIEKLVHAEAGDKTSLEKIAQEYPLEIRETAIRYGEKEHNLLISIHKLNEDAQKSFESLIQNYPPEAKKAFQSLLRHPEIVSLLSEHMKITVETGDLYKRNPGLLSRQMDSLNMLLATENAKNLEEWEKQLNENPEAMKELKESGEEFAKEKGYKEKTATEVETVVVTNYVYYPYNWWFGYPWWYEYPCWYPYPWWYDRGFYTGPGGIIVFISLPSPYFIHWHFHHPHHHYHYSHLSDHYIRYYYGRRRSVSGSREPVNKWIRENEPRLPKQYLKDDVKRPSRIKELGAFEMGLGEEQKKNSAKPVTRENYLKANKEKYPSLSETREAKPVQEPVYKPRPYTPQKQKESTPSVTPSPAPERPRQPAPAAPSPTPPPAPAKKPEQKPRPSPN